METSKTHTEGLSIGVTLPGSTELEVSGAQEALKKKKKKKKKPDGESEETARKEKRPKKRQGSTSEGVDLEVATEEFGRASEINLDAPSVRSVQDDESMAPTASEASIDVSRVQWAREKEREMEERESQGAEKERLLLKRHDILVGKEQALDEKQCALVEKERLLLKQHEELVCEKEALDAKQRFFAEHVMRHDSKVLIQQVCSTAMNNALSRAASQTAPPPSRVPATKVPKLLVDVECQTDLNMQRMQVPTLNLELEDRARERAKVQGKLRLTRTEETEAAVRGHMEQDEERKRLVLEEIHNVDVARQILSDLDKARKEEKAMHERRMKEVVEQHEKEIREVKAQLEKAANDSNAEAAQYALSHRAHKRIVTEAEEKAQSLVHQAEARVRQLQSQEEEIKHRMSRNAAMEHEMHEWRERRTSLDMELKSRQQDLESRESGAHATEEALEKKARELKALMQELDCRERAMSKTSQTLAELLRKERELERHRIGNTASMGWNKALLQAQLKRMKSTYTPGNAPPPPPKLPGEKRQAATLDGSKYLAAETEGNEAIVETEKRVHRLANEFDRLVHNLTARSLERAEACSPMSQGGKSPKTPPPVFTYVSTPAAADTPGSSPTQASLATTAAADRYDPDLDIPELSVAEQREVRRVFVREQELANEAGFFKKLISSCPLLQYGRPKTNSDVTINQVGLSHCPPSSCATCPSVCLELSTHLPPRDWPSCQTKAPTGPEHWWLENLAKTATQLNG